MARRALLRINSFEYRYQQEYGLLPDYDLDRLHADPATSAEASRIWQSRIDSLWSRMKYEHEHRHELEHQRLMQELCKECPF